MYTSLFFVYLGIFIAGFILEQYLDYLNNKMTYREMPSDFLGFIDKEKFLFQQQYQRTNYRTGIWSSGFNFLIILLMLLFFGFAFINKMVADVTENPVLQALLFFGIILLAGGIMNLPFSLYDTFVTEEKFGMNKTTPKTFILDLFKSLFVGLIIGGGLLALITWIYEKTGSFFWWIAWIVMAAFSLFMSLFYSSLIVPLFNKQEPLPGGDLRDAIRRFADKTGFRLDDIYVMDGSKRSVRGNAYFTGLGPRKRIVLYDTLIGDLTNEEIVAVIAHETGHFKKKHIVWGMILGFLQTGLMLFLFSLFAGSAALSRALGVDEPNFHTAVIAFGILYSPFSLLTGILLNIYMRRKEFEADEFAAANHDAWTLASALRKLSVRNLSNLTPHPLYVFFNYSHPPLLQRVEKLKK